jgi:hypothetical protein
MIWALLAAYLTKRPAWGRRVVGRFQVKGMPHSSRRRGAGQV